MQNTLGHKASQPGLRGHSHDPDQDLMKQFVVARKLPTGGNLWVRSFNTFEDALDDILLGHPLAEKYKIIDQFNNETMLEES